ncbi:MAG: opacity protein-like surface antigen [Neolewinella sp.]|jgi:opacity protein-like surface antigen
MRLTLLFSLLIAALNLNGQSENKGKFYLSGNTSFSYSTNFRNTFSQSAFESTHLGYFLTNRLMVGAEVLAGTDEDFYDDSPYIISPFIRYYLPVRLGGNTQLFAEGGFGTIGNFSFGSNFETDYFLGLGAERSFGDGVVGTARLRYKAKSLGLNFTELDLGLNFILGGKQNWDGFAAREKGGLLIDPDLGRISFGHRSRDNFRDLRLDLNVGLGYFLTQNLLVEAGYTAESIDVDRDGVGLQEINTRDWEVFAGLRYFVSGTGKRLQPYVLGRAGLAGTSLIIGDATFGQQTTSDSFSYAEVGAGALYYLTKNVALDFSGRYQARFNTPAKNAERMTASAGLKVFLGNK